MNAVPQATAGTDAPVVSLDAQLAELTKASQPELVRRYRELLGRYPPIRDARWLRRRVAYAIQERVYGGLSQQGKVRLQEIISSMGLNLATRTHVATTKLARPKSHRGLSPGTTLRRIWHGKEIVALIRDDGSIEANGQVYPSLSATVREIGRAHV